MLGHIYSVIIIYIAVLMEFVLELRGEYGARNVLLAVVICISLPIIGFMFDDRKYYRRFKLHSVTLWGKDFNTLGRG
jgi:undecaprenyl pyrophosphate phosphatase UppP